jgi:hypothetical protein
MKKAELKDEVRRLRKLIRHAWVHSGYTDCGYYQMTTEEKADYRRVIGRSDADQRECDEIYSRRHRCTCETRPDQPCSLHAVPR